MALIGAVRRAARCGGVVSLKRAWTILQVLFMLQAIYTGARSPPTLEHGSEKEPRYLKIATIQMEPFVELRYEPGLIANDRYEGMYIDLLKELARELDFDYQLLLVPDGKIGQTGEDGSWNGLIGGLNDGYADLALAPIATTEERKSTVGFTIPLSPFQVSALSHQSLVTSGVAPPPYGLVVNSEPYFALRANQELFDRIRHTSGVIYINSVMEGLFRTRGREMRLLINTQLADYYIDQEPCDLVAQEFHTFPDLSFSIATKRGDNEMLREIDEALGRLMSGSMLMERLEQKWLRGTCRRHGTLPTLLDTTTNLELNEPSTRQLVVTSIMVDPYLMTSTKRGLEFEGYIADLIRQMARVVPFEYEWKIKRRFGRQRNDGSWSGMIGDLMDEEADFAAGPFMVEESQKRFISFSKPFLESTLSILVKTPTDNGEPRVHMIEDLLNQTTLDYGVVHNSRIAKRLKKSKLPLYKKLWKKLKSKGKDRENRVTSIGDGLNRVRAGKFALILESTDATLLSSQLPCDLVSLSQYLSVTNYAFATKRGSPLVAELNTALLRLQEDGVLQALFHKWWNTDECSNYVQETEEPFLETTTPLTTTPTTTTVPTLLPLQPNFEFDLDALLGLSTDPPPLSEDGFYEDFEEDRNSFDIARLFLTSPVSAFTPIRSVTDDMSSAGSTEPVVPAPDRDQFTFPRDWEDGLSNTTTAPIYVKHNRTQNASSDIQPPIGADEYFTSESTANNTESDAPATSTTAEATMETSTKKKRKRPKKTGKRKGKKNKTTTVEPPSSTTPLDRYIHQRDRSRDFDMDINWFFATERPRPDDSEINSYDNDSDSSNLEPFTPYIHHRNRDLTYTVRNNFDFARTTPSTTTTTTTLEASNSGASSRGRATSEAVLFVVVLHLLIFGWPSNTSDCIENCNH